MDKKDELIEYIIKDIISYIMEEKMIGIKEAMRLFYHSKTFKKLQDKETGLYLQGSAYIYQLYKQYK